MREHMETKEVRAEEEEGQVREEEGCTLVQELVRSVLRRAAALPASSAALVSAKGANKGRKQT